MISMLLIVSNSLFIFRRCTFGFLQSRFTYIESAAAPVPLLAKPRQYPPLKTIPPTFQILYSTRIERHVTIYAEAFLEYSCYFVLALFLCPSYSVFPLCVQLMFLYLAIIII